MPLKILHLEDNERDAILIEDLLNQHHIACTCIRVETEAEFCAALAREKQLDLVLADLSLPAFDGKSAMRILSRERPHVPFIFVSGTLGEESAIESIKLGATDYVLKSRLSRLPLAVERAVAEARERNSRRQLEQQLLCVQRLEGFGMIAAGITHDLKNLLHPVKFASCLIEEECGRREGRQGGGSPAENKKLLELAALIRNSADRGIEMVDQVMGLFRVAEKRPQRLEGARIVAQLADLVGSAYPDLEIITEVASQLPAAYGQPNEIHQALLNLAMNARDAMHGKGRLWIGAAPIQLDEAFFTAEEPGNPGEYLHLWVRDSGPGIPQELLDRIFEPLFTTKKDGAGTGLGLVSVTIIVRNHRGYSRVSNLPEGGAQFDLYFRAGQKEPEPTSAAAAPARDLPVGNGERIGLIADEAALRAVLRNILATYGYEIRVTESSTRALQAFEGEEVDLMILDWEPSALGGPETARLLQLRQPAPIIVTTTHHDLQLDDGLKKLGVAAVLHRPFDTDQLLRAVDEVLRMAPR